MRRGWTGRPCRGSPDGRQRSVRTVRRWGASWCPHRRYSASGRDARPRGVLCECVTPDTPRHRTGQPVAAARRRRDEHASAPPGSPWPVAGPGGCPRSGVGCPAAGRFAAAVAVRAAGTPAVLGRPARCRRPALARSAGVRAAGAPEVRRPAVAGDRRRGAGGPRRRRGGGRGPGRRGPRGRRLRPAGRRAGGRGLRQCRRRVPGGGHRRGACRPDPGGLPRRRQHLLQFDGITQQAWLGDLSDPSATGTIYCLGGV